MDLSPIPPPSPAEALAKEGPVQPQPITPTPPSAPVAPAKSKNWLLISLVIFVILVSLGTGGFFAYQYVQLKNQVIQAKPTPVTSPSPTPDPTASWKTYTLESLTFKYPDSLTVKNIPENTIEFASTDNNYPLRFWINILDNPKDLTFAELHKNAIGAYDGQYNPSSPTLIISGITSLYRKSVSCEPTICDQYTMLYNHKIYSLENLFPSPPDTTIQENQRKLFGQILSTFKFTNKTSTDTSNWITFSSSNGKFIFKYPQGYKVNENIVIGVDGVSVPTPNTVQALSPVIEGTNGNISITITYKNTPSDLPTFITSNASCSSVVPAKGVTYLIGATNGLIFKNTPCGSHGATYVYFVHGGVGYIVTIESTIDSKTTELNSDQILSTFKFTQ